MKNIRSLFRHWKKQNKKFFKFGQLREETLDLAIESFVHYLELHEVKPADAQLYLSYFDNGDNYIYYVISTLAGFVLSEYVAQTEKDVGGWTVFVVIVLLLLLAPLVSITIRTIVRKITKGSNNFLKICLSVYLDLHKTTDSFKRLTPIRGNLKILVPPQVECVYDDLIRDSKYYWKAHAVCIIDGLQPFNYVFYTNKIYTSDSDLLSSFYRQCFSQVGKQWENIDDTKITICEIKTVNFLEYE